MKIRFTFLLVLLIGFSLVTSCKMPTTLGEFFTANLFAGLDKPNTDTYKEPPAPDKRQGFFDTLERDMGSPGFAASLTAEELKTVTANLEAIVSDTTAPKEEQQKAAILWADLELQATGGDMFINNLAAAAATLATSATPPDLNSPAGVISFVEGMITMPADATAEEKKTIMTDVFNGLIAAGGAYTMLNNSIDPANGLVVETNNDGLAQSAVVCNLVVGLSTLLADTSSDGNKGDDIASLITNLSAIDQASPTATQLTTDALTSALDTSKTEADITSLISNLTTGVSNITAGSTAMASLADLLIPAPKL